MARMHSEFNSKIGLYSNPAKYYDQNLVLFALGAKQHEFWFDAQGNLNWVGSMSECHLLSLHFTAG